MRHSVMAWRRQIQVVMELVSLVVLTYQLDISTFATAVRIPTNCLEGIWDKASTLLSTDDAIVPAPGVGPNAKYVLSYSGSKPHLVVPKKATTFACDSDCPNWKALGICAHSVAVADLCKKLPEFIEKFKKIKQTPNLTKFAEATMPKGRGRKGSEPPRKRKKTSSTAEVQQVQNPAFSSSLTVEDSSRPMVNVTSQCNVSSSNATNINVLPSSEYPSLSNAPTCSWPCPSWFSPPYQNFSPLPQAQSVPSPYQNVSPPPPSSPFQLCKLGGNITICFGCHKKC